MFKWFKKSSSSEAITKADTAIDMATELINDIRHYAHSNDPIKSLISDLWRYRNNTPFVTTVYEAIQEVKPYSGNGSSTYHHN